MKILEIFKPTSIPDFIIIGVPRAGTSTVYDLICSHPDVQPAIQKEIGWITQSKEWYLKHFPSKRKGQITGEATPMYFIDATAPERFFKLNPDIKIILLKREPFNRAYSDWCMNVFGQFEPLTFEESLHAEKERINESSAKYFQFSYMNYGNYEKFLPNWKEHFPDMLTLDFEELQKSPDTFKSKLWEYLNLKPIKSTFKVMSIVPKPVMDKAEEIKLRNIYKKLEVEV